MCKPRAREAPARGERTLGIVQVNSLAPDETIAKSLWRQFRDFAVIRDDSQNVAPPGSLLPTSFLTYFLFKSI